MNAREFVALIFGCVLGFVIGALCLSIQQASRRANKSEIIKNEELPYHYANIVINDTMYSLVPSKIKILGTYSTEDEAE